MYKVLNLNDRSLSQIPYERFVFPDGQDHIKIDIAVLHKHTDVHIITRIVNASDLFILMQVADILRFHKMTVRITYLLAARMDRRMSPNEALTLKIVADTINSLNFEEVDIVDPHSDVATTLIDRSVGINNSNFIYDVLKSLGGMLMSPIVLIAPDAGAAKKVEKLSHDFFLPMIQATKTRDVTTGKILSTKIDTPTLEDKIALVVDDICDGGATFIPLAQELRAKKAAGLILAVTHGIFSKGLDVLSDFDRIYTTNSYKNHDPNLKLIEYTI
jgi:ribose-phosphate pyrophosphokinase